MAQTSISVRMDTTLKQEFDSICSELGLTMSTVVTMLAKKMTREKRLPFEVSIETQNESDARMEAELKLMTELLNREYRAAAGARTFAQDEMEQMAEEILNEG